ncbi:hypothetical protein [Kosakonia oryzae]|uniref:Polymerase beta nucleotidyltransferase domain-containing protein n=1 Tax=Kosakonia oryzae TaxID=497725 RepID=A0AA94KPY5_9ENTR|nr:hypothetical protein [Kosakonia oryzae]ANI81887.1 hypothetical protein AWR26_06870 [Kosakonia oryzae]SFC40022.1 hypothetical protein SAMN05216286_2171 [Kosakonia oryzae]
MYASVLFGSKAKGLSDEYSDNDLLVICHDDERDAISNNRIYSNYNISFFSFKQLHMMRDVGSLFLQHIKKDGIILYDKDNEFKKFLDTCNLILPTKNEIMKCESTLFFIKSIPYEQELINWKADFLYCVSRDYLIKKLALNGKLAFSIDEIVSSSIKWLNFEIEELSDLKTLRKIKTIHRSTSVDFLTKESTTKLTNNWLHTLSCKCNISMANSDKGIFDALYKETYNSTYEALRTLEALSLLADKKGLNHIEQTMIMKYLHFPNMYKSLQKSKSPLINKYIKELYNLLNLREQ